MKSIKLFPMALLLSLFLFLTGSSAKDLEVNETAGEFQHRLDQRIPGWMERYEVPGITIALIKNGQTVWSGAYGFADVNNQIQMKPESVCRVESISKSVTARGVMKLVEMGKIQLDDPVYLHLESWEFPESDFDFKKVTIRHLLSHSSGLSLGSIGLEYDPQEKKPSLRESLTREVKFVQEPGKSFIYSNVGFNLLELLIEDVSGQSFTDYMKKKILLPLGMQNASYEWREDYPTKIPNGHKLTGEPVPVYVYSEKGAGGLFANVEDFARFVGTGMLNDFYSAENVLTQNSIRELYAPVIDVSGIFSFVADHYGLGHFIETLPNGQMAVFGGGQGNGWMTHFHLVPETGDGIVILTNSSRSWPLISHILSDWTEWIGIDSVGMGIISKVITGIWILILLIMAGLFFQLVRIIRDYLQEQRQFDLQIKNYSGVQFVQLAMVVILISVLIWSLTREYLMITAVFPGVSEWFLGTLFIITFNLLLSAIYPRKVHDYRKI
jgi:CubicO group peptidase (beta-lactamase class C family)